MQAFAAEWINDFLYCHGTSHIEPTLADFRNKTLGAGKQAIKAVPNRALTAHACPLQPPFELPTVLSHGGIARLFLGMNLMSTLDREWETVGQSVQINAHAKVPLISKCFVFN